MSPCSTSSSFTNFLTCPGLLGPQPCDRRFPGSGHPERTAGPKPHWCPHSLLRKELSRHSLTPPRGGWWRSHPSAVRRTSKESMAVLNIQSILEPQRETLTRTWNRTMSSWLLAMKLLSRTPRLNQLPRQRNTLMNIFSSLPVFSTHDVYNTPTDHIEHKNRALVRS